ncbi:hypothetical protein [Rhodoferax sp.]|uniref:hypothetical protein n=1 Tax=Rhodoferax sp. TaxID=50421 RepID=UPI001EC79C5B|nr:hypothetical protein [Rhodoferax sp.]MBT9505742.1 hypothetical protein [Rhodoferax sp.]
MQKVQTGDKAISPAIAANTQTKVVQMGAGGFVTPAVKAHVQKKVVQMGSGFVSPTVRAHLQKNAG